MRSRYDIVDYRILVSSWYNEFLPEAAKGKAIFIDGADIVYLKSLPLESLKKGTLQFMSSKLGELSNGDVCLVFMEPKPVDNPRLQRLVKFIDGCKDIEDATKTNIMHLANRRYVVKSDSVLVSCYKEIEGFLDQTFMALSALKPCGARFHKQSSLGMSDVVDVARSFFPRSQMRVQGDCCSGMFNVMSTNDVLSKVASGLSEDVGVDKTASAFIDRSKRSFALELERLV